MIRKSAFLTLILSVQICAAQAPAGSTALCNDGTYSKGTNKLTACLGHKGIKTWYGAPATTTQAKPAPAAAPAAQSKPATAAKAAPTPPSAADIADAKAKGLVWVNLNTKVYHMSSASQYGTTKNGKFMSEADAKAAGYREAKDTHGKAASK